MFRRMINRTTHKFWTVITAVFSILITIIGIFVGVYEEEFPMFLFLFIFLSTSLLLQLFSIIISYLLEQLDEKNLTLSGYYMKKEVLNQTSFINMIIDHDGVADFEGFKLITLKLNTKKQVISNIQSKVILNSNCLLKNENDVISCQEFGGKSEYVLPNYFIETTVNNIYKYSFRIKPLRINSTDIIQMYVEVFINNESHYFHYEI